MEILIPVLIVFPFVAAAVLSVLRHAKAREVVMYAASVIVMLLAGSLLVLWLQSKNSIMIILPKMIIVQVKRSIP